MRFKVSPRQPATHFFSTGYLVHVVIDCDAVRIYLMSYLSTGLISISSLMISPIVLYVWKISPRETYSLLCLENRSASTLDEESIDHRWSTAEEWSGCVRVCPNTVQSDASSPRTARSLVVNHLSCGLSHSISTAYRWADRDVYPSWRSAALHVSSRRNYRWFSLLRHANDWAVPMPTGHCRRTDWNVAINRWFVRLMEEAFRCADARVRWDDRCTDLSYNIDIRREIPVHIFRLHTGQTRRRRRKTSTLTWCVDLQVMKWNSGKNIYWRTNKVFLSCSRHDAKENWRKKSSEE